MTDAEFKDKFVAFVDVIGFSNLVTAAESGTGMALPQLLEALKCLGTLEDQRQYESHGPRVCPASRHARRDLDFRLTQVSDCVIVSAEVSPCGLINMLDHCWRAVIELLAKGIMCRGYITRGLVYHVEGQVIGSGYMRAYKQEHSVAAFKRHADERGTPFVEIDQAVCEYIAHQGDKCVMEWFDRFVATDGTVTALFPFQQIYPKFFFDAASDGKRERTLIKNTRLLINNLKRDVLQLVDRSNEDAVRKSEHYVAALDAQLTICDRADFMMDRLFGPSR